MYNLKPETIVELRYCNDRELNNFAKNIEIPISSKAIVNEYLHKIECDSDSEENEVVEKIRSYKKSGDKEYYMTIDSIMDMYHSEDPFLVQKSQSELYHSHHKFIRKIIATRYSSAGKHYEDMLQSGTEGLFKAMRGYKGNYAFTTYSYNFIVHEITEYLNNVRGLPSAYHARLQKNVRDAILKLQEKDIQITIENVCKITGLSEKIVKRECSRIQSFSGLSLDDDSYGDLPISSRIVSPGGSAEDEFFSNLKSKKLEEFLMELSERKRNILCKHICEKESYAKIASEMNLDVDLVKEEYKSALKYMKSKKKIFEREV